MLSTLFILGGAYVGAALLLGIALGRAAKRGDDAMREAFAVYVRQQLQSGSADPRMEHGAVRELYRAPKTGHAVRATQ